MANVNTIRQCGKRGRTVEANRFLRLLALGCAGMLALIASGCSGGGGGGGSNPPPGPTPNPVPAISSISPANAPAGSRALTLTVTGSRFIAGSVVQWGGSARTTTYVSSTRLNASITPGDLATAGAVSVTVFNPTPGGGTSGSTNFLIDAVSPLTILTKRLPDAARSKEYSYVLQASGGILPYSWTVSSGTLPGGLSLASSARISGTAPAVSSDTTSNFTVQVRDNSNQPPTVTQPLSIVVRAGSLARNDGCGSATPLPNGLIRASISPYGDMDVYSFQGTAGSKVSVETYAQRLDLYGDSAGVDIYLDTLLEILSSGCAQLSYNDDISLGDNMDSLIQDYTLPYTGTYYIRVSDLRGDGRPDFIYDLRLSGAN